MKKSIVLVLAALMGLLLLCASGAMAATENGFSYSVSDECATIYDYTGSETNLIIPDTLGGYPVTTIRYNAFIDLAADSVTLPESVTTIGDYAFSRSTIKSVTLPGTLTTFGTGVFANCPSLESVTFSEGIEQVGANMFYGCAKLSSVLIGSGVTTIGSNAFYNCSSLQSVALPDSVSQLGNNAFYGCSALRSIVIPDGVSTIERNTFYNCAALESVSLGSGVTSIGQYAFYGCSSLPQLTLPQSVTTLSDYALYNCTALTDLTLSQNITSIGSNVFYSCPATLYATVGTETAKMLYQRSYAFTDVRAPYFTYKYYSNTGWQITAFDSSVTDVVIPEGFNSIGSNVFKNNTALTSVSFPSTLETIGSYAFSGCTALTSVNIPGNVKTINNDAFNGCLKLTSVTLNEGIETISSSAFYDCTNLPAIDIPGSVKTIGWGAFYNCLSLSSVTLREGLESIGSQAFYRCILLTDISLPSTLTKLDSNVFYNSGITSVVLPENMTTAYTDSDIRYYVDKDSVTAQNMATKPNYSIKPFTDPQWPNLSFYYLINEYTGEKSLQLYKYYGTTETSVTLPDFITGIYNNAFYHYSNTGVPAYNTKLEEIHVPSSVTSIGGSAFTGCSALKAVYLPDNVTSFGTYIATTGNSAAESPALYCSRDSVTAKNITTSVYRYGFTDPAAPDYSLAHDADDVLVLTAYRGKDTALTLPGGITAIGEGAFSENKTIKSVVVPEGVTEIRGNAFYLCSALADINFPSTLVSIGRNAFNGCSLTLVTLPDSLTTLGHGCFRCSELTAYLPDNITTVDTQPFYDTAMLYCKKGSATAYTLSADTSSYRLCDPADPDWKYRYNDDGGLVFGGYRGSETELTIPDIYVGISSYAFSGNDTLKKIVVPDSVTSLGYSALSTNAEEIRLPDNITDVNANALPSWGGGTVYVVNPDSVTFENLSALGYSFSYCDPDDSDWVWSREEDGALYIAGYRGTETEITLPDGAEGVLRGFDDKTPNREAITSIRLPNSIRYIGTNTFLSFDALTEVHLPDNIEEIDTYPFEMRRYGDNPLTVYCSKGSTTASNFCAAGEDYAFCDPSDPDWLWRYESDGTTAVGGYRGSSKAITLPAGATAVAEDAFYGNSGRGILSVTIPEGYTTLGRRAFAYSGISHFSLPSTLRTLCEEALDGCDFSSIQLPEGLETIGENAFDDCHRLSSLTIPSTVTRIEAPIMEDSNLTTVVLPAEIEYIVPNAFGESLSTVYCYRNTYAQEWALDNSPLVKLIGSGTLEALVKLTLSEEYEYSEWRSVYEVGSASPFMTGISVGTLPIGANYTFTCKSSDSTVARVDGDVVTFLKPGEATLTISIAERSDVTPIKRTITVYNPVTSFTVPDAVFVHIDAWQDNNPTVVKPENVEPAANANPYFRYRYSRGSATYSGGFRDDGVEFWPEEDLGAYKGYIESMSGIQQPILFITYDEISEVYATAPARPLVIGEIWQPDVTVMVDGAEMNKHAYLYTLKTSNSKVAAVTTDGKVRAVAPGTATITVTARNSGRTAKFSVTVTEAVTLCLPASLKAVSEEAFTGVSAGEVIIPDGCTAIGARAFADCASLYAVTIPASVTVIAEDAFAGCTGVTVTTPAGSTAAQMFDGMDGFTVVTE